MLLAVTFRRGAGSGYRCDRHSTLLECCTLLIGLSPLEGLPDFGQTVPHGSPPSLPNGGTRSAPPPIRPRDGPAPARVRWRRSRGARWEMHPQPRHLPRTTRRATRMMGIRGQLLSTCRTRSPAGVNWLSRLSIEIQTSIVCGGKVRHREDRLDPAQPCPACDVGRRSGLRDGRGRSRAESCASGSSAPGSG